MLLGLTVISSEGLQGATAGAIGKSEIRSSLLPPRRSKRFPGGRFGRDDSGHPFSRNPRKLDNPLIRNYLGHDRGKVDQSKNMGVLENPLAGNHSSCFRTDLAKSRILCS